jgi:hypothetical protein
MEEPSDLVPRGGAGHMIVHETQRFMARRMAVKVRLRPVDHAPMVTARPIVVDIIREATRATVAS